MLLVGLTGGIASGKSLVARVFKDLGAHLIDADRIVHELLEPGQQAWRQVVDFFGSAILLPDNRIDRRKLGAVVFGDAEKRNWLNGCIHPLVFDAFTARVKHLRERCPDDDVVVFEAALLIETGYHRRMDTVVVVCADEERQIEHLMARDKYSRDEALRRIRSQMPLEEKRRHADYIISNTGSREETERQAREVFLRLRRVPGKADSQAEAQRP